MYVENATENIPIFTLFQYYSNPSHIAIGRIFVNTDATQSTRILQVNVGLKGNMLEVNAAMLPNSEESKIVYTNKNTFKDKNFYLAGFYISALPADTTVLIYGARV